jgi:hypothetical protein
VIPNKGTYFLEKFDKTELASTYSSNCLKKFAQRNKFYILVVRQIEERRVEVTNQALVRKCKQMDKIWTKFMKELPKLVEDHLWNRLCHQARYDSRVVDLIPLYRTDSCE